MARSRAVETDRIPICTVTDQEMMANRIGAWSKDTLYWRFLGSLGTFDEEEIRRAYSDAWEAWEDVLQGALVFEEAHDHADVTANARRIDGPGKVLAWSQLPTGNDSPLLQAYDLLDRWEIAERPRSGNVDLLAVMVHEIGHALGLDHDRKNTGAIMEPYYVPGRRAPQAPDIRRIRALYPARTPPRPPAPRPSPGVSPYVIRLDGPFTVEAADGSVYEFPGR